jgi:hypothetical protein
MPEVLPNLDTGINSAHDLHCAASGLQKTSVINEAITEHAPHGHQTC